jgi:hypothetical protein
MADHLERAGLKAMSGDEQAEMRTAICDNTPEAKNFSLRYPRLPTLTLAEVRRRRKRVGIRGSNVDLEAASSGLNLYSHVRGEGTFAKYDRNSFLEVAPVDAWFTFDEHLRKVAATVGAGYLTAARGCIRLAHKLTCER